MAAIDDKDKRFSMLNFADGSTLALLPDRDGSIDANDRVHLLDLYGGISLVTVSLNLRLKFGTIELLGSGALAPPSGGKNVPWKLEGLFVVRRIGASGVLLATGEYDNGQSAGLLANVSASSVDTTTGADITVSAQWSVADPGNSITVQNLFIEKYDP